MLPRFNYLKPKTIEETLSYLKEMKNHSTIMAGGTDLLVQIRAKLLKPDTIIDVKDIPELKEIRETSEEVYLGGAVTFSEIMESSIIGMHLPVLGQAARQLGSPQIRNLATIGGNIQTASPAGDGLVALFGSEAEVELISPGNERKVSIENFIIGPQKTSKKSNELLKGFKILKRSWDFESFFKVGRRNALAISVVNGVIKLDFDGKNKKIVDARIILGAVAPTPIRIKPVEDLLKAKNYTKVLSQQFRGMVKRSISPISDIRASKEYREYIAAVICDRIIGRAMKDGGGC